MFGSRSKTTDHSERAADPGDPRYYFASSLTDASFEPSNATTESYCLHCRVHNNIIEAQLLGTAHGPLAIIGLCAGCRQPISRLLDEAKAKSPIPGQAEVKKATPAVSVALTRRERRAAARSGARSQGSGSR